jgi:hypothetical protein
VRTDGSSCWHASALLRRSGARDLHQRFLPVQAPGRTGPSIRDASGDIDAGAKRQGMHVGRPHDIAVEGEATTGTGPLSAAWFLVVAASRTVAAGAPLGATEAHDACQETLVGQIRPVSPVFPVTHPLLVMPSGLAPTHPVRVADKEQADPLPYAKVDDLARPLVPQITDASLGAGADLAARSLQFAPSARALGAPQAFARELSQGFVPLAFQGAHTTTAHYERVPRVGDHGGLMDFPQVHTGLHRPWRCGRCGSLNTDVQLEAVAPDQLAGSRVFRQLEVQHQGGTTAAHRQDDEAALSFHVHSLPGPEQREPGLRPPGVLDLAVGLAVLTRRLDVGQKGLRDRLDGLRVEGEPPFHGPMQVMVIRPVGVLPAGCQVQVSAEVPGTRGFLPACGDELYGACREMIEPVDPHCLHRMVLLKRFFLLAETFFRRETKVEMRITGSHPIPFKGKGLLVRCR